MAPNKSLSGASEDVPDDKISGFGATWTPDMINQAMYNIVSR